MSKPPPNTPATGDRVKLRGRNAVGTLRQLDRSTLWSHVQWDDGLEGPSVVHLHELEKI